VIVIVPVDYRFEDNKAKAMEAKETKPADQDKQLVPVEASQQVPAEGAVQNAISFLCTVIDSCNYLGCFYKGSVSQVKE
jgi:hypothetical protein